MGTVDAKQKTKSRDRFQIVLVVSLVLLSAVIYLAHWVVFRDAYHIYYYTLLDIAFLPIEVLLVTLIIDRLLERREKQAMMTKMNMVIGTFYTEVGTALLRDVSAVDKNIGAVRDDVLANRDWSARDVAMKRRRLSTYMPALDGASLDLARMKAFLGAKRDFLLRLLENPNLLEHEKFTDLLWAVFHLLDELSHRADFADLPPSDLAHLTGDIQRAYLAVMSQWVDYMKHLRDEYPYLFSLALRSNPFDVDASVIVKG
jgi:hypothetical protein